MSANLHRRHLDASQRAMVAARAAEQFEDSRADNQKAGLKRGAEAPVAVNWRQREDAGRTAEKAAALTNVAPRSVERAAAVIATGSPELVAAVDRGEVAVSAAAEVARLPQEEQRAAVEAGTVPAKAKAIREGRKAAKNTTAADLRQRLEAAPHGPQPGQGGATSAGPGQPTDRVSTGPKRATGRAD